MSPIAKGLIGAVGAAAIFGAVATIVYLRGGVPADQPNAADAVADAAKDIARNLAQPCAAEVAAQSVARLLEPDMKCE